MKDIDFDELDRAVGSALGTDDAAKADAPATPVATATADASSADTPVVTDSPAEATPAVKPASPARKRGQFLDMVHPSADMRSTTPLPPVAPRKTITPINADTAPEPSPAKPAETSPEPANPYTDTTPSDVADPVTTPQAAEETVAPDAPTEQSSWPDPLDFAASQPEAKDEAEPEVEEQPSVVDVPAASDDTGEIEPSQTPFVTDAKVDKRPLGAFASAEDEAEPPVSPHAADAAQLAPSVEETTPEFSSDLNSVEAAGVPQVEDNDVPAPEAPQETESVEPVEPVVESTPDEVPAEEPAESPEVKSATDVVEPASVSTNDGVAQSIPQQYKTGETKTAEDAHPLFDTKEYHQPLLPDGKKKSKKGLWIIILLTILLIIGGALGYFAYTMGI